MTIYFQRPPILQIKPRYGHRIEIYYFYYQKIKSYIKGNKMCNKMQCYFQAIVNIAVEMNVNRMALISADHRATRAFLAEAANVGISVEDIYEYRSFPTIFSKGMFQVDKIFAAYYSFTLYIIQLCYTLFLHFQHNTSQPQQYPKTTHQKQYILLLD